MTHVIRKKEEWCLWSFFHPSHILTRKISLNQNFKTSCAKKKKEIAKFQDLMHDRSRLIGAVWIIRDQLHLIHNQNTNTIPSPSPHPHKQHSESTGDIKTTHIENYSDYDTDLKGIIDRSSKEKCVRLNAERQREIVT